MSETQPESGRAFAKIAFSDSVKSVQETLQSRRQMSKMEVIGQPRDELDDNLIQFIRSRSSFYLGTASKDGEPYIQHRGGEPGFIEVLGRKTLRIVDYPGNRQYITFGNLQENSRAFLFLMDYENKSRVKLWADAEVENLEGESRAIVFHIKAWDLNCPKHIPEFYSMQTVQATLTKMGARIAELEAEIERLQR